MQRAVSKKGGSRPVIIWFPIPLIIGLDRGVVIADLDRSKFVRAAVREKLDRINEKRATR